MSKMFLFLFSCSCIASASIDTVVFAGGCFWCMEPPFEKVNGVNDVVSGYMGGKKQNPSYNDVSKGNSGYREVVRVVYESDVVSFESLMSVFWKNIDPTDKGGQFADRGKHYTTAVFYYNDEQKKLATLSKMTLQRSKKFSKPIATEIIKAQPFYAAEDEHQNFYKTNEQYYSQYKKGSGREDYIKLTWGENVTKKIDLRKRLTALQYRVTQENGTEPPFSNEYNDNKRDGIYVDIVSGEPLFWSGDKFESGSGWPSFTKPLEIKNVVEKVDKALGMVRREVRSKKGDSHLGHVFPDGPAPTGLRYCINSASLRFIPKEDLDKEGYTMYKKLFMSGN